MTTVMFLGMSFCLPIAFIQNWLERKRGRSKAALRDAETPLLEVRATSPDHSMLAMLGLGLCIRFRLFSFTHSIDIFLMFNVVYLHG